MGMNMGCVAIIFERAVVNQCVFVQEFEAEPLRLRRSTVEKRLDYFADHFDIGRGVA